MSVVNDKQTTDELNMSIFFITMKVNVSSAYYVFAALIVQYTKFLLAFKYLAKFFQASLPQPFTPKESVFSVKLFKRYIDCFSSMCELITTAVGNSLYECKKSFGISDGAKTRHVSLKQNY